MNRSLWLAAAFAIAAAVSPAAAVELKVSNFTPAKHPFTSVFLKSWVEEVKARSTSPVEVTVFSAGSAFGHVAKQLDQVRAGVTDAAHGLTGIPRGRLPRTSVVDLPFLFESADAASRTLWEMYERGLLADEFKGLKVLALHAHNPGLVHTREKQVLEPADLAGQRIRFPSLAISMMLKQLGASPVGLPPTQVYENLQKGVIDGTVFPWDAVGGFKLYEVLKYHLAAKLYTTSFYFVMNEKKYDALPADVRSCIDKASGPALVAKFGPWWDQWDKRGLERSKERGNVITVLDEAGREKWRKAVEPVVGRYLAELKKQGVENPQALYDEVRKIAAKYNGRSR